MKFNPRHATGPVTEIPDEEFDKIVSKPEPKIFDRVVSVASVNVRRDPDKDSPSLGVLYNGSKIEVESFDNNWYKVAAGDYKGGYVRKPFLK